MVLSFKSESITAQVTRQENGSVDKSGCTVRRSVQGSRQYLVLVTVEQATAASKPASSALRFISSAPRVGRAALSSRAGAPTQRIYFAVGYFMT
jgi:hypothetical protein